tara:strand:- start:278 stop:457 length:180 start_codon:yes stop_codon:yes gene_type:complete
MKRWTEAQKEWMGYKRREAYLDKEDVTLPEPPWKDREISVAPLPEPHADLREENKCMKD